MTIVIGWWLIPALVTLVWAIFAVVEMATTHGDFAMPITWLLLSPVPLLSWIIYLAIF